MKKHLTQSPLKDIYRSKKETKFFHKTLKCIVNPGRIIRAFSWCLLAVRRLSFPSFQSVNNKAKPFSKVCGLVVLEWVLLALKVGSPSPFNFSYLNSWNKPKVNLKCQFSWLQEDFWPKIKTKYINQGIIEDPLKSRITPKKSSFSWSGCTGS